MRLNSLHRYTADTSKFLRIVSNYEFHLHADFESILAQETKNSLAEEGIGYIGSRISLESPPEPLWGDTSNCFSTICHHLLIDRGISWDEAESLLSKCHGDEICGFYKAKRQGPGGLHMCALAVKAETGKYRLFRPATGESTNQIDKADLLSKYQRFDATEVSESWKALYEVSMFTCMHGEDCAWRQQCTVGRRTLPITVISGSVIKIWDALEYVQSRHERALPRAERSLRVLRLENVNDVPGNTIIGVRYPRILIPEVLDILERSYSNQAAGSFSSGREEPPPVNPRFQKRAFSPPQKTLYEFFKRDRKEINKTMPEDENSGKRHRASPSNQRVSKLCSMGFSVDQSEKALRACKGSLEEAVNWILSNP